MGWLASKFRVPPCLHHPSAGITNACNHTWLFYLSSEGWIQVLELDRPSQLPNLGEGTVKNLDPFHIFPIKHHTFQWQIMPFLLGPRFIMIFKGKKWYPITGTFSQNENQMDGVSWDLQLQTFVSAAVTFHPFPVLLLPACWAMPKDTMSPGMLPLLHTPRRSNSTLNIQRGIWVTPCQRPAKSLPHSLVLYSQPLLGPCP